MFTHHPHVFPFIFDWIISIPLRSCSVKRRRGKMLAAIRKRVTSASTLSLVRGFHSTKALCNQQVSVDIVKAGPKIMDTLEQTHTDEVPDSLVSGTFNELTKRKVVIYRPTKNAMQSRHNESKPWSITFEPTVRFHLLCHLLFDYITLLNHRNLFILWDEPK